MEGSSASALPSPSPVVPDAEMLEMIAEAVATASPKPSPAPWPTIGPPLPSKIHEPITIVFSVIFILLTLVLLFQVFRVWYYRHKKLSYFNICLTCSLLWSILRTVLLVIYAVHRHVAENMSMIEYVTLYVLPTELQYAAFSLVVLYFVNASLNRWKGTWKYSASRVIWVIMNLVFLVTNITCVLHLDTDRYDKGDNSRMMKTRVIISEAFFLFACLCLICAIARIRRLVYLRQMIEGQGVTVRQMVIFTAELVPIFVSRSIYNLVAISYPDLVSWGYRWTFLSDRADRRSDEGTGFVFFVGALFLWEIIPMFIITWFFWVPKPKTYEEIQEGKPMKPRTVFFDSNTNESSDDEDYNVPGYGSMNNGASYFNPNSSTESSPYSPQKLKYGSKYGSYASSFNPSTYGSQKSINP